MWRTSEGSTGRLIQLCIGYFAFYVITTVTAKYYIDKGAGFPQMQDLAFTTYSTFGGTLICVVVVLAMGWTRIESARRVAIGPVSFPSEWLYIVPSGVCTAIVIPTTTLMYMLPITVMVAMVVMRGAVIVISRAVDAIQIRQGILTKHVYREENAGVVLALMAVAIVLFVTDTKDAVRLQIGSLCYDCRSLTDIARVEGEAAVSKVPPLWENGTAMGILGIYIVAYALRIYIMNYFKNTSAPGVKRDNRAFFGVEQLAASTTLAIACAVFYWGPWGGDGDWIGMFRKAVDAPHPRWLEAVAAGTAFGIVAFFSVFLFMFKGRTATFAGLVNRLTSLIAGTTATLLYWFVFDGKPVKIQDWLSLGLIFAAVAVLTRAERRRAAELAGR